MKRAMLVFAALALLLPPALPAKAMRIGAKVEVTLVDGSKVVGELRGIDRKWIAINPDNSDSVTLRKLEQVATVRISDDAGKAAEKLQAPPRRRKRMAPNLKRALLENGAVFVFSAAHYWSRYANFVEDWQFDLSWAGQRRKFFTSEGLRFDSNNMRINGVHNWAGAMFYNWARVNNLSPFVSFLFSSGTSLLWEYVAEWREVSSINDHLFTWMGGPAIGEPLYQIAAVFRGRPGLANRIACLLVDPVLGIDDLIKGRSRPERLPLPGSTDFRFRFGGKHGPVSPADGSSSHAAVDLDLRLVTLPGYGQPGTGSGYARRPIASEYHLAVSFNERMYEEFFGRTRTVLAGWWWRDVVRGEDGGLRGSESWLGWLTSWDLLQKKPVAAYDGKELGMTDPWFERETPARYRDKYSSIHLIGPAYGLTRYAGPFSARLDLGATVDFSMVNSLPYNDYSAGHDVWGVKTNLHNWGYYYSFGYTLTGRADLRWQGLRLEAGAEYQRYASIQGLDRFQEDLKDDSRLADSRFAYRAALSVDVPRSPLFVSLEWQGIDRWGRFHELEATTRERRFFYRLGARF